MSLLDKVKETAKQAAADAKKGAAKVQSKVEQGQLRRKADESAKQLGYLIFRERTKGEPAGEEADRLVEAIVDLEQQIEAEAAQRAAGGEPGAGGEPDAASEPEA